MTLFPPQAYRKTAYTHRQGERADQPLATDVLDGTLYFVVDEGITERSDGTAWSAYSGAGSRLSYVVNYSYSINTASPPGTNQVRFNAGYPYTAVTKLYFWNVTADGQDVRIGLMRVSPGSLIYIQDKNDNTQYATFLTTAFPTDHTTWVEYDVTHYAHGNSIGGGQLVLVQSTWGPTTNPTYTPGSVPFAGAGGTLTEDNSNFFFNDSTDQLKVTGSILSPLIIGGTGVTDDLSLQATSGVGTTGSWIFFKVGNNGATTAMEINHNGLVGIGTTGLLTLQSALHVRQSSPPDIGYVAEFRSGASCYIMMKTGTGANEQAGFTCFQQTNAVEWRFAVIGNEGNSFRCSTDGPLPVWYATTVGNLIINNTYTPPSTGTKTLIFGDGTVPASLASNTAGLYANDVSGTVNMFAINEAGGSSQLTGFTAQSVIFASSTGGFTEDTTFTFDSSTGVLQAPIPTATRSTFPRVRVNETGQAANSRLWRMMSASQIFYIQACADDESTAADGIAINRSGFITGASQPAAAVINSSNQSISDTTITVLSFDTEIFDRGSCHAGGSPTRLTVPTGGAGIYIIYASTDYAPNSTGLRLGRIRKNGATNISTAFQAAVVGDATICQCVAIASLADADYVESIAYQTSGGALNVRNTTDTSLSWVKVW